MKAFNERLSFANVTSGIALFIALGGTGYAAANLPTGSIGTREIRTNGVGKSELKARAVGKSEVRTGAVGKSEISTNGVGAAELREGAIDTTELKDAGIEAADLSAATVSALSDVPLRTAVNAAGAQTAGNAKGVAHVADSGAYTVDFDPDLSACQLAATRGTPGLISAEINPADKTQVVVTTTDTAAPPVPQDAPFHLLVAC
jgi:hypothetical protein